MMTVQQHALTLHVMLAYDPTGGKSLYDAQQEFLESLTASHTHYVAVVEGLVDADDVPVQPRSSR